MHNRLSPWQRVWHTQTHNSTHTLPFILTQRVSVGRTLPFYSSTELDIALNASCLWGWTKDNEASGPGLCLEGRRKDGCKQHQPPHTLRTRPVHHMAWWWWVAGYSSAPQRALYRSETLGTWGMARCFRQAYSLFIAADRMSFKLLNMHQQTTV